MIPRPFRSALAAAAVLAAAAGHAAARAPRAEDHPSLDALLLRLQKERDQDAKTPTAQDAFSQYENGITPLDGFKPLTDCLNDSRREQIHRERATTILLNRFRKEAERRTTDPKFDAKAYEKTRNAVLREVMDLMLKDEPFGRLQVRRLTDLLEPPLVWKSDDTYRKRKLAYELLKQRTS